MHILHKILIVLVVACCSISGVASVPYFSARLPLYSSNSKLAEGKWVKIKVDKAGIYKISFDKLRSLGFRQPEKVRVFGYGGNLLSEKLTSDYYDDIPEVNSFVGDSYILFYGVGAIKWIYDNEEEVFSFSKNSYTDFGSYFLSDVDGERRTIQQEPSVTDSAQNIFSTHISPDIYLPEKVNVFNGGTVWFDQPLSPSNSKTINLFFANMVDGEFGKVSAYYYVPDSDKQNYKLNLTSSNYSYSLAGGSTNRFSGLFQNSKTNSMTYNLRFTSDWSSASCYLHYLLASALCNNKLDNGYLFFNNKPSDVYDVAEYRVTNASAKTVVWKINSPLDVTLLNTSLSGDTLIFKEGANDFRNFAAFNPDSENFLTVDSFIAIDNQNLHASKGADLVILSPKAYLQQARQLADLHADYDGISSLVVTQEEIFNEFSSGTADPTAIRSFLKMMYDRGMNDESFIKPKYLLLFGDGCFDNKGILRTGTTAARNLVLTYQTGIGTSSYPADDYFGMLADNTRFPFYLDSCVCHVAVGRLPFINSTQASQVVEKIGRYMKDNNPGKWKMNTVILADDNEASEGALHGSSASYHEFVKYGEMLSGVITRQCPSVIQNKVYYDSYTRVSESSGYRYPEVEQKIIDNINNGAMFINYIGHSNPVNWSAEKTFTQSQVANLTNNKLGVWVSASCDFSEYDNYSTSCGEALVLAPNGGAIAVVATSRSTYSSENNRLDTAFTSAFFAQKPDMAIGDMMRQAKNVVKQSIRVKYPLMGDPALRIHFPSMQVVTDYFSADTFSAMSRISVSGHIENDGNEMSNFNGKINITVFDKEQTRSTKGNLLNMVTKFKDYVNVLYSGETNVVNGAFNFQFLVPNDISYSYGQGRIAYYAYDKDNGYEAIGDCREFVVGGASDSVFTDVEGPVVRTYINSSSFRSGDVVGANPVFIAELHDNNGINASGIGLGHDITISINGADKVNANEYFVYDNNSYTDGKVFFPLADLEDGVYTVEFKSWDMLGNSSVSTISFTVNHDKAAHIDNIVAVGNPAREATSFIVSYDRILTNVAYDVEVYNLNGVMVTQFSGSDYSSDGSLTIDWDLSDSSGKRVQPGVYVCRVNLKSDGTPYVGASEKIMVLPQ